MVLDDRGRPSTALHDPFAPYFHRYARAARRAQPGGRLGRDWDLWENLLFWDDRAPERSYTSLPRSYHARGIEDVAVRSDWSRRAVWGALKSGPYVNYQDNGEEYFDKGSLSVVNGDRPLLVNANGALLRNTPGSDDGDSFWQKIYDDVLGDGGRRDIFNIFYGGEGGQGNRLRRDGSRTRVTQFADAGSYVAMTGGWLADQYPRGVRSWTRHVVYVRPGVFVVADDTTVTDPGADQHLAFHLGGRLATASAPGGTRRYDVTGARGFAGSVDTVLPAGHRDTTSALFGSSKVTQLIVRPSDRAVSHHWLTVVDAARSPQQAVAASALRGAGIGAGVLLGRRLAVVFAVPRTGAISFDPQGAPAAIVAGLRAGASYSIHATSRGVQLRPGHGVRANTGGAIRLHIPTTTSTRSGRTR